MARREYARIGVTMPEEESIKALNVEPQWLYDRLLLRPEISRCGVIPWVPGVIADLAANATERKVSSWVKQLVPGRHVILDDKHQLLLVRTFVKHDKLLAQPNVIPHLVYEFGLISSPKVRLAFLQEFRRLWSLTPSDDFSDSERGGWLLAVGHFPQRRDPDNPAHKDLRWPQVLDSRTLARLVKEVGTGLRAALCQAITAGQVAPFTPEDAYGVPDPFQAPHPGTPSPPPHPGTPAADPPLAGARAHSETETETRYFVPPTPETVSVSPDPASRSSADTRTPAEQLVEQQIGRSAAGAVRSALLAHTQSLLDEGHAPTDIATALADWRQKPSSGAGLLPWLLTERLLKRDNAVHRNGHDPRPTWCGHCDETTRTEPVDPTDDTGAYRRCPRCHPLATTPDTTDDPWTPPTALSFSAADQPRF
jgi:hypothetical protein